MKKSDFHFEKQLLIEQLTEVPEREIYTYQEANAISGLDVQSDEHRHILQSALDFVAKNHRLIFRNVRNTGYQRLSDPDIVCDTRAQTRINGQASKGMQRLAAVDFAQLSPTEQKRHNAKMCSLKVIELAVTEKVIRQIEGQVKQARESTVETKRAFLEMLLDGT